MGLGVPSSSVEAWFAIEYSGVAGVTNESTLSQHGAK